MKFKTTPRELMDWGMWEKYCQKTGTNPWAMAEGLMDSEESIELSHDLAKQIGIFRILFPNE